MLIPVELLPGQAVLDATDTWFIGRVSPDATAAIGAVYWPVLVFVLLFGGVGLSVQTFVAQAFGARRFIRSSQIAWTALWASLFAAPLWAGASGIPPEVSRILINQGLPAAALSVVIMDPDTGRVLVSEKADTLRSPASTIKTVTTFAALDMLGPSFVWHTRAAIRGTFTSGVLDGDLILQGGGDPYITLERWWSFAQNLRAKGLRSIRGDIVVDNSAFALPPEDPGTFDGKPNRPYNVLPDALMVNFQTVEFRLAADADAHRVAISESPAPFNLVIDNRINFATGRCGSRTGHVEFKVASDAWDRVEFTGALSPDCAERSFSRVLLKPASYAFGTFVQSWRESGGEFTGNLRVEPSPADARPYLTFDSLSLAEIIRLTNKFSSNLMARHLLLTIGAERFGLPATVEKGAATIAEWGASRGVDLNGLAIENGSGLSRGTRISALQMARVLSVAVRSRLAPEFMSSLPLAGLDGTLRARMKGNPVGSVRLKTGHIDGVSGVAGYVSSASGKLYVLVSLVNHPRADIGAAEPVHAALVNWILENL